MILMIMTHDDLQLLLLALCSSLLEPVFNRLMYSYEREGIEPFEKLLVDCSRALW